MVGDAAVMVRVEAFTTTLIVVLAVAPDGSVTRTVIPYVPTANVESAVTTPDEWMVIPETDALSEVRKIDQDLVPVAPPVDEKVVVPELEKLTVMFPPPEMANGELTVTDAEVVEAVPTPIPLTARIATV